MRPLRLELRNFACYRQPAVIEFNELPSALFAITGPTGSGKSMILDAIIYALYGQTPRLGSRGMEALMGPEGADMLVQLTFRVNGEDTYRVTRQATRKSKSVATEVRIDRQLDPAGAWAQLDDSEKVKDANAKLAELVGLDYDGFIRAVMLPQGAFDEFLRGDSAKRRKLLSTLLGLDLVERVRSEASQLSNTAKAMVTALQERLSEDFANATPDELKARKKELKAASKSATEHGRELERCEAHLRELELAIAGIRPLEDRLDDLGGDIDMADLTIDGIDWSEAAWEAMRAKEADVEKLAHAETRIADLEERDRLNIQTNREEAQQMVTLHDELEAKEAEGKQLKQKAVDAYAAVLDGITENAAHEVRRTLNDGDTCPVCEQVVAHVPELHHTNVEALKEAQHKAEAAVEKARGEYAELRRRIDQLDERVTARGKENGKIHEELKELQAEVTTINERLGTKNAADATATILSLRGALLASLAHTIKAKLDAIGWSDEAMQEAEQDVEDARKASDEASRKLQALEHDVKGLEAAIEKAAELKAKLTETEGTFELYRTLALDLRGDRFQDFLMARAQRALAAQASVTMRSISGGRYDLSLVDGDYYVTDAWADGQPRSARTLSGGESFLASLSLALALADTISGSVLGSLFIDEGFGTLDPDTLELVTEVLEALTLQGRTVGIITHVEALTGRMPAVLRVTKGASGSTIEWEA